jgi:RimJ/RimL family protein N-acetyltransferase
MELRTDLLTADRVRLAPLTEADVEIITGWYEDVEFMRLFDARPAVPKTQAEVGEWLEEVRKARNHVAFGVRLIQGDVLIGVLEFDGIIWPHRVSGVGLSIGDRAYWGQGYGSEAARLGIGFAFDEMNMHRLTATVFSYNVRSISLLKRLGFRQEGAYREFLERDGRRYDMLLFGLLRHEWET